MVNVFGNLGNIFSVLHNMGVGSYSLSLVNVLGFGFSFQLLAMSAHQKRCTKPCNYTGQNYPQYELKSCWTSEPSTIRGSFTKKRKHCWNRYREFIPLYPAFHSLCGLLYVFWISFLKWNPSYENKQRELFYTPMSFKHPVFSKKWISTSHPWTPCFFWPRSERSYDAWLRLVQICIGRLRMAWMRFLEPLTEHIPWFWLLGGSSQDL